MSAFDKFRQAAGKPASTGATDEAAALLRDGLAKATAALGRFGRTIGPEPFSTSDTLSCFGKPASFDFAIGLAGLRASGLREPATTAASTDSDAAQGRFEKRHYAGRSGARTYRLFIPSHHASARGLLVMLHGCSQRPEDFAAATRMNLLGQQHNMLVAYPEQSRVANAAGCWNWFERKHQDRGEGEPGIIAGLAAELAAEFGLASKQVFIAGLSAGGAMAAAVAELHPDGFAGVGVHSGLPYRAADTMSSAISAMRGVGRSGETAASQADSLALGVPTIVFHGDADPTVHPRNGADIVTRIRAREAGLLLEKRPGTAAGRSYDLTIGRDTGGMTRFEHWSIHGAGHAWSGGSRDGSYADPTGPNASVEMMRFFLALPRN